MTKSSGEQPNAVICKDGSTLFEWYLPAARFGISIEQVIAESSWFYVTDSGVMVSGVFPDYAIDAIARALATR